MRFWGGGSASRATSDLAGGRCSIRWSDSRLPKRYRAALTTITPMHDVDHGHVITELHQGEAVRLEAAAAVGIGPVGDDSEVAHLGAADQQLGLARPDADCQITSRSDGVLRPVAIAGHIVDLCPLADQVALRARFGQGHEP